VAAGLRGVLATSMVVILGGCRLAQGWLSQTLLGGAHRDDEYAFTPAQVS